MVLKQEKPVAVVLFQLGGPDSLEAVQPFLYKLFCDPDIIDFPGAFLARKGLARYISSKRGPKVAAHYKEIGGKSPIFELTSNQARSLEKELNKTFKAKVFIAMRYWHPLTEETIAEMKKQEFSKVIFLPLYAQYYKTTTGSSFKEWEKQSAKMNYKVENSTFIQHYYNHPLYIQAIVENLTLAYKKFSHLDPADVDLVFSAHGLPISIIESGDPYKDHIEETVRLVIEKSNLKSPHILCYQSKVGPAQWLKPSLNQAIHSLATSGRKHILIIPIAFVTEHIETLHEINIEAREHAEKLGIEQFEMMPALNDSPTFIACLKDLVLKNI